MNNHDKTPPLVDLELAMDMPVADYSWAFNYERTYFWMTEWEILELTQWAYIETAIPKVKRLLNRYKRWDKTALKKAIWILLYLNQK